MSNQRLLVVEDLGSSGDGCIGWTPAIPGSLWTLNRTYAFLMPAYVLFTEASEQVLGYAATRQVFDIIRIEDGSIFGQTSQINLTGCDIKLIGRYHNEARRLAVHSGNTISLYRFGAPLAVDKPNVVQPSSFRLYPCYPNPFNPSTTISFSLPKTCHARVEVFDLTGRHVRTLTDDIRQPGEQQVVFEGNGLTSGIYFARVEAGNDVQVQKLMLLK